MVVDYGFIPEAHRHSEVAAELAKRDAAIARLSDALRAIAYCDDEGSEYYEPHPLYRTHMILLARRALDE